MDAATRKSARNRKNHRITHKGLKAQHRIQKKYGGIEAASGFVRILRKWLAA